MFKVTSPQFAAAAMLIAALAASGCEKTAVKAEPAASASAPAEAAKPAEPAAAAAPEAVPPVAPVAAPVAAPAPLAAAPAGGGHPAMKDPKLATESAPDEFKVKVVTTKGDVVFAIHKAWSPAGADRFYNLVKIGYFADVAFFRSIAGFMCQFGIHGDPEVNNVWKEASIQDDPPAGHTNAPYTLTFAKKGMPNSRSVQFFINFKPNSNLDGMGFTPFGEVVEGKDVVDKISTEYGDTPNQMRVQSEGNRYLKAEFPNLDYVKSISLL